jgi:hypothetical protein
MKIVVLEDNRDRCQAMRECLTERFYPYEALFFAAPEPMIRYLDEHLDEAICISLDHDMELVEGSDGQLHDPGSGWEVAEFLAGRTSQCPVILHTTSALAAQRMQTTLAGAGWTVHRVAPWGDLAWVRADWFRTVRRAVLETARPLTAPNETDGRNSPAVRQTDDRERGR